MKTIIEVNHNGKFSNRETRNYRMTPAQLSAALEDALIGLDPAKAVVTIKFE